VQILGDRHGNAVTLANAIAPSTQHQKLIEESPPVPQPKLRKRLPPRRSSARRVLTRGTIEFHLENRPLLFSWR
jgi:acetyl/propionyl-CoA carboxylase alpha subunit